MKNTATAGIPGNMNQMNFEVDSAVDNIIQNPILAPKQLVFRGTIATKATETFFYKEDSLGIGAASTPNMTTGGIQFTMPTGYSVAVLNKFLQTYALVARYMNITNSDSTQLGNSIGSQELSLDGRSNKDFNFVSSAELASNQNPNLLNVNEAVVLTLETFLTYPIQANTGDSDPNIVVTVTLMKMASVPYALLDRWLDKNKISRSL